MKHLLSMKVRGGALQFVVFTGVAIAIILMGFVTLTHVHLFFKKQAGLTIKTVKQANIGMHYAINNENTTDIATTVPLVLGNGNAQVTINRTSWGLFEVLRTTAIIKKNTVVKTALIGGHSKNRPALYLKEENRPLVLVGTTSIQGAAYLPKQGARPGTIAGNAYYGNTLIQGRTLNSTEQLPRLPTGLKNRLAQLQGTSIISDGEILPIVPAMNYSNSFLNTVQYVYNDATIYLERATLTGNIIVKSEERIVVDASSRLTDVILIAPEIIIKPQTTGTFQAIASKKISIADNCILRYPSAFILKEELAVETQQPYQEDAPQLRIGKGAVVKGVVLHLGRIARQRYAPHIVLEENASVYGEVYCEGIFELKGTVNGSVYISRFTVNEFGSIYQNHIYNGNILAGNLPEAYTGLPIEQNNKTVMKWLY
ncbi:hypothetical protein [Leptobacterium sp. I13]|uniref:hypothetical protein n=1 Tax=Leptobacterium meishanense TaxID=3128904 RepID=UPI0030ED0412